MNIITKVISHSNSYSLQPFISYFPFNEKELKKQINEDANNKLGG